MIKSFYFIACAFLVVAIIIEMVSKAQYSKAAVGTARAVTASEAAREMARNEARRLIDSGRSFSLTGNAFVVAGIISWIASVRDEKRRTQVVPIVLVAAYALLWLLME